MGYFFVRLDELLFGFANSPKKLAATLGLIVLPPLGFFFLYCAVGGNSLNHDYALLAIGSFIAAFGLLALRVKWRIQELRLNFRKPEDAYAVINQLRLSGELTRNNSSLIRANWAGVTLEGADLHDANLSSIGLEAADLRHANLEGASLRGARLEGTNLRECDLTGAILRYARLQNADLRDAQLVDADLRAADLSHAQLQGAYIDGAQFDAYTTLPDGSKWVNNIYWSRFGARTSKHHHPKPRQTQPSASKNRF